MQSTNQLVLPTRLANYSIKISILKQTIQEYPQMAIKAPISCEMQEFLKKQDDITIQGSLDSESGIVLVKRKED